MITTRNIALAAVIGAAFAVPAQAQTTLTFSTLSLIHI